MSFFSPVPEVSLEIFLREREMSPPEEKEGGVYQNEVNLSTHSLEGQDAKRQPTTVKWPIMSEEIILFF